MPRPFDMPTVESVEQYLLSRCRVSDSGCWEWRLSRRNGYPCVTVNNPWREVTGHRLAARAWLAFDGIGSVLHRCDNKICVNPEHLWIGTPKENTRDMIAKGRQKWIGAPKLTLAQVVSIKARALSGEKQGLLAQEFGVDRSAISRIKTGRRWLQRLA